MRKVVIVVYPEQQLGKLGRIAMRPVLVRAQRNKYLIRKEFKVVLDLLELFRELSILQDLLLVHLTQELA